MEIFLFFFFTEAYRQAGRKEKWTRELRKIETVREDLESNGDKIVVRENST